MQQELARHYQTNFHTEKRLLSTAVKHWYWKKAGIQNLVAFLLVSGLLFFVRNSTFRHEHTHGFVMGLLFSLWYMLIAYIIATWLN
jgi:hypothetical protein